MHVGIILDMGRNSRSLWMEREKKKHDRKKKNGGVKYYQIIEEDIKEK